MARDPLRSISRSAIAAYLCICAALLLLFSLLVWDLFMDMGRLQAALLDSQIGRLRSQAERTVARIERDLEVQGLTDLRELDPRDWLHQHWRRAFADDERGLYAAVLDPAGKTLLHSDATRQGARLPRNWYDRVLVGFGDDVVETTDSTFAADGPVYDVKIPIESDGREVGEYHIGLAVDWFQNLAATEKTSFLQDNALLIGGVILMIGLATGSLYFLAAHTVMLRREAHSATMARATEISKLAAGLAHEIRNPLHAIRLNLHSFRRVHEQKATLSTDEVDKMLEQSTQEIDRIGQLIQQLVGFAPSDDPRREVIDLSAEIRDVVEFIRQEMLDKNIEINLDLPDEPVKTNLDRGRLRQIMLNLLGNAQQALEEKAQKVTAAEHGAHNEHGAQNGRSARNGHCGRIDVILTRRRGHVEIAVADDGEGMPNGDCEKVFEPFYSTKTNGSGLGLALVKRFVDDVDGQISCHSNARGGLTFEITLHEARSA